MLELEDLPHRPLSAVQAQVLAALEVDVYRRRVLPISAHDSAATAAAASALAWADQDSVLARALAQAAGFADVTQWCGHWLALGEALPDLAQLRADPGAKRSFWRRLRQRMAQR
ncbi:MAG: hypothetical protein AB7E72_10005 [Lysobacterales bacterium]